MRLTPISKHTGKNLRKFYRDLAENPGWAQTGSMMLKLVEHLEDNVAGPDVWTFTSHADLVLNDKNTWRNRLVTVNANAREYVPDGYEITYQVEPPWFRTSGYTEDVVAAGEMIVEALKRAARQDKDG